MPIDQPDEKVAHTDRGAHVDMRVDVSGNVFSADAGQNVDPATTTGSVQVTGGGTTTQVFTSQTLTSPSLVLATLMSVSITTSNSPTAGTVELRRAGTVVTTIPATTTGNTSTSNIVTEPGSPQLDVRVNGLGVGAGTATVNFTAITFSREQRW